MIKGKLGLSCIVRKAIVPAWLLLATWPMSTVLIRILLLQSRKTSQPVRKSYLLGRRPMLQICTAADKTGPGSTLRATVNTTCHALLSISQAREAGQQQRQPVHHYLLQTSTLSEANAILIRRLLLYTRRSTLETLLWNGHLLRWAFRAFRAQIPTVVGQTTWPF